jgi:hypothetical protein
VRMFCGGTFRSLSQEIIKKEKDKVSIIE